MANVKDNRRPVLKWPKPHRRDLSRYPIVQGDLVDTFTLQQKINEEEKCVLDPGHFIDNYNLIKHPVDGLVPFIMYDYQRYKVMPAFMERRFCITRKFRQGGFTTLGAAVINWMINFSFDQEILIISKTDREAMNFLKAIYRNFDYLPEFLRAGVKVANEHVFELDTGSLVRCYTPTAGVSFSCSLLVIDEVARVQKMDEKWSDLFPVLSTGGRCWLISTCNGVTGTGAWYYKRWTKAVEQWQENPSDGVERFFPLDVSHEEHPDYRRPEFVAQQLRELGPVKFRQEVLREFINTKGSVFSSDFLLELEKNASSVPIIASGPCPLLPQGSAHKNIIVYQEPQPGKAYIVSFDTGEGLGYNDPEGTKDDQANFSACYALDMETMEIAAEYRNDAIKPEEFSKITTMMAMRYNDAVVVSTDMAIDQTVFSHMEKLGYTNFFREGHQKPGLKIGGGMGAKRSVLVLKAVTAIEKKYAPIASIRLVNELRTLTTKGGKIQAQSGYFDDLFSAYAYGWQARELIVSTMPPGAMTNIKTFFKMDEEEISSIRSILKDVSSNFLAGVMRTVPPPLPSRNGSSGEAELVQMRQQFNDWGMAVSLPSRQSSIPNSQASKDNEMEKMSMMMPILPSKSS